MQDHGNQNNVMAEVSESNANQTNAGRSNSGQSNSAVKNYEVPLDANSENSSSDSKKIKIPDNILKLKVAGDIVLVQSTNAEFRDRTKRYFNIFEKLANCSREERLITYGMIMGLTVTGHAKHPENAEQKKHLFDLKNELLIKMLQNDKLRSKIGTKYLVSKHFRVMEYCPECVERNTKENIEKHKWKYCSKCNVDKNYFNVLSLFHKNDACSVCAFLGQEHLKKIRNINFKAKTDISKFNEGLRYKKLKFSPKLFRRIELDQLEGEIKKLSARLEI